MILPLADARATAHAAARAGDATHALRLLEACVRAAPTDHESRLDVADVLLDMGARAEAAGVYAFAARFCLLAGHPLAALCSIRVLDGLGAPTVPLLRDAADRYAAGSTHTARRAARLAVPPDTVVDTRGLDDPVATGHAVARAVEAACSDPDVPYPAQVLRVTLLSDLPPDGFAGIARALVPRRAADGEPVLREGDPGASLLLLASGRLAITRGDPPQLLGHLGEGALLGEMALLTGGRRTATARAVGGTRVLELSGEALAAIARAVPSCGAALDRFRRERLLGGLMATSPLFAPLSHSDRMELASRFAGQDVPAGAVVIEQGPASTGLFVVLSGEVAVRRREGGDTIELARLHAGDVFGELSMLHDVGATATVVATQPTSLLWLPRKTFHALIDGVPELRGYFDTLAAERLEGIRRAVGDEVLIEEAELVEEA